jgi:hypothetical protein
MDAALISFNSASLAPLTQCGTLVVSIKSRDKTPVSRRKPPVYMSTDDLMDDLNLGPNATLTAGWVSYKQIDPATDITPFFRFKLQEILLQKLSTITTFAFGQTDTSIEETTARLQIGTNDVAGMESLFRTIAMVTISRALCNATFDNLLKTVVGCFYNNKLFESSSAVAQMIASDMCDDINVYGTLRATYNHGSQTSHPYEKSTLLAGGTTEPTHIGQFSASFYVGSSAMPVHLYLSGVPMHEHDIDVACGQILINIFGTIETDLLGYNNTAVSEPYDPAQFNTENFKNTIFFQDASEKAIITESALQFRALAEALLLRPCVSVAPSYTHNPARGLHSDTVVFASKLVGMTTMASLLQSRDDLLHAADGAAQRASRDQLRPFVMLNA